MDFHAAMETFAEAWAAANVHTVVNSDPSSGEPNRRIQMPSKSAGDMSVAKSPNSQQTPEKSSQRKETKSPPSSEGAKSLPIHCAVEQVSGIPSFDNSNSSCKNINLELDSYAILPTSTTLCDLVRVALTKLGYSSSDALNAKGAIQLKNWKPLSFERISDNLQATVEDILGDLTNVATLKIRICSKPKSSSTDDVKEKLLQLLLNQSQAMLLNTGCPIDKVMLSSISQGHLPSDITAEMRRDFDLWFSEQLKKSTKQLETMSATLKPESPAGNTSIISVPKSPVLTPPSAVSSSVATSSTVSSSAPPVCANLQSTLNSGSISASAKHTRMRTSFDPEHEIPRLQKWFHVNQHPTREQMIQYLSELNTLDSRKGRKQLDLTNIIYWFKNARAAYRRANKSADDSQIDADESLCLSYQEADEPIKEEEGATAEERSSSPAEEAFPYLPNRNAVYVIPNPLHRVISEEQATDLSTNRDKEKTLVSPKLSCHSFSDGDPNEDNDEPNPAELSRNSKSQINREISAKVLSSMSKRKRTYSEDSYTSGDEENEPTEMKHQKAAVKREVEEDHEYLSAHSQGHLSRELSVLAQSPHNRLALSIPHMPHPLAMHYIPLNAQYYHAHLQQQQQQRSHLAQQQLNVSHSNASSGNHNNVANSVASAKAALDKKRRTRVFIDPLTEIPKLEQWFLEDTHPSAYMIDKYCEELNHAEYRRKYPRLEPKNVQLWFKNHRAKVKRMRVEGPGGVVGYKYEDGSPSADLYDYEQTNSQNALNFEMENGRSVVSA